MNYIKLQTHLIKTLDKYPNPERMYCEKKDGYVYFIPDPARCFKIPEEKWFVAFDKMSFEQKDVSKIFNPDSAEPAVFTGEFKELKNGRTVRKIANDKQFAWVDETLLKEFEPKKITGYRITNQISPVYIYEEEACTGMICPVRVDC